MLYYPLLISIIEVLIITIPVLLTVAFLTGYHIKVHKNKNNQFTIRVLFLSILSLLSVGGYIYVWLQFLV